LVLTTTWVDPGSSFGPDNISGGTDSSGVSFGSAPATLVSYIPPSTTYLTTAAWGTPTVAATVS
jgi:hypothetical protein